jgi:hypothetical protein
MKNLIAFLLLFFAATASAQTLSALTLPSEPSFSQSSLLGKGSTISFLIPPPTMSDIQQTTPRTYFASQLLPLCPTDILTNGNMPIMGRSFTTEFTLFGRKSVGTYIFDIQGNLVDYSFSLPLLRGN